MHWYIYVLLSNRNAFKGIQILLYTVQNNGKFKNDKRGGRIILK